MNAHALEQAIDLYDETREKIYSLIRNDSSLLGEYEWLRYCIMPNQMTLGFGFDAIYVYGSCHSMQTAQTEFYDFAIPFELLED